MVHHPIAGAGRPAGRHRLVFGVTGTHAISPAINPRPGYDPRADFEALSWQGLFVAKWTRIVKIVNPQTN